MIDNNQSRKASLVPLSGFAILLILLSMMCQAFGNISVYNLQALGLEPNYKGLQEVSFSIANFGFVPFGKTLIGQLVISPNLSDECEFQTDEEIHPDNTYFMLIPRGNCKFVSKALNAQKAGAKAVIIMDNETQSTPFIMADNGQGYKVKIPSIFISLEQGQKLIDLTQLAKNKSLGVSLKIKFQNKKTQKVDMKMYLQSYNRQTYKLVREFREYYESISSYINLKLVYYTEYCPQCLQKDCYFKNQYCQYDYIDQDGSNGRKIMDQQIRENIIFDKYPNKWWSFMEHVGEECSRISQLRQCSVQGMKMAGIDTAAVQSAFDKSFDQKKNNTYLNSYIKELMYSGVLKYPSVSLNNFNIRGTISAEYLFDDICNTLVSPPQQCNKYVNQTIVVTYVKQYWFLVIGVIIVGFVLFSGLFILYKRYMKKKITHDMQHRVDDMVSKYIEFYSERSGKK